MPDPYRELSRIAGPPRQAAAPQFSDDVTSLAGRHLPDLRALLTQANRFLAFESALQVFPSHGDPARLDLEQWNRASGWKSAYEPEVKGALFFAQDVFGFQFAIHGEGIHQFDPETGTLSFLADSLTAWWQAMLLDYPFLSGYPLAHEWQLRNRPLQWEERLYPKKPFFIGGEFEVDNLFVFKAWPGAEFRAYLYSQTKDLPDGTTIDIRMAP